MGIIINMRTVAILALLGLAVADSAPAYNELAMMKLYQATAADEDSSDSESEDEQDVYLNGVYQPWQSGQQVDGYERVLPNRFTAGSDDIFMRSVLANYAQEGKDCDKAWGHFDVNKSGAIEALKAPQLMRFLASDQ